jgi:hypothetical protein
LTSEKSSVYYIISKSKEVSQYTWFAILDYKKECKNQGGCHKSRGPAAQEHGSKGKTET